MTKSTRRQLSETKEWKITIVNRTVCTDSARLLTFIYAAHCANIKLSFTSSFISGKCQLYHSRTRIANVLISDADDKKQYLSSHNAPEKEVKFCRIKMWKGKKYV